MIPRNSVSSAAIAIAIAAGLVSCSSVSSGADSGANSSSRSTFDGAVPEFSGPWASEFAEAYRSTTDSVMREILAKESITDQDYARNIDRWTFPFSTSSMEFGKCISDPLSLGLAR